MPNGTDRPTSNPSGFAEHRKGDPDIPEETYGSGHDSFNEPQVSHKGPSRAVPIPETPPRGQAPTAPGPSAVGDAKFLVDEFGMNEHKAASIIAETRAQPEALVKAGLRAAEAQDDPLAGVPTPREPKNDLTPDNDEERLKPVLHVKNKRVGAG
jgi:hypothetical protein